MLLAITPTATLPGEATTIPRPTTPLSESDLLTNATGEPTIGNEIALEIESADHVDVICAFIRWSGIRQLFEPIRRLTAAGKAVRFVTTTYLGSTERRALDELVAAGAQVRVSYDDVNTRLHAKAWLFARNTGYSTAYVGSSNLSVTAQHLGLEWNVRLSAVGNPELLAKVRATFDTYWESPQFEDYDPQRDRERFDAAIAKARGGPSATTGSDADGIDITFLDVTPKPFQARILDELEAERERHNRWRNLVVAATGTGKTVIAALDYRRLRDRWPDASLLFVAHRAEILNQSRRMFRTVLRDGTFGETYVGGARPERWRHVFASIQSLAALGVEAIDPTAVRRRDRRRVPPRGRRHLPGLARPHRPEGPARPDGDARTHRRPAGHGVVRRPVRSPSCGCGRPSTRACSSRSSTSASTTTSTSPT